MAKKKNNIFKVYFEDNGDMKYSLTYWERRDPVKLASLKSEDNHIWNDTMEYVALWGNRVIFKSAVSGRKYYMPFRYFHEVMRAKVMRFSVIEGDFTFVKHGHAQGFKMILPPSANP